MTDHTPGTWVAGGWSSNGTPILKVGGRHQVVASVHPGFASDADNAVKNGKANAFLIAAAPDLLKALEKIVVDEERRRASLTKNSPAARFSDARLKDARDAISRAYGEI